MPTSKVNLKESYMRSLKDLMIMPTSKFIFIYFTHETIKNGYLSAWV